MVVMEEGGIIVALVEAVLMKMVMVVVVVSHGTISIASVQVMIVKTLSLHLEATDKK